MRCFVGFCLFVCLIVLFLASLQSLLKGSYFSGFNESEVVARVVMLVDLWPREGECQSCSMLAIFHVN